MGPDQSVRGLRRPGQVAGHLGAGDVGRRVERKPAPAGRAIVEDRPGAVVVARLGLGAAEVDRPRVHPGGRARFEAARLHAQGHQAFRQADGGGFPRPARRHGGPAHPNAPIAKRARRQDGRPAGEASPEESGQGGQATVRAQLHARHHGLLHVQEAGFA